MDIKLKIAYDFMLKQKYIPHPTDNYILWKTGCKYSSYYNWWDAILLFHHKYRPTILERVKNGIFSLCNL